MFSFLYPVFLWAATVAVIPLILHMMQKRRIIRLPFSTIRFLKLADKRSSRRIRLENFLLWLLRTVVMLLIILGFAMPVLRTTGFGSFMNRSQRDVAVVLDGSYSMAYSTGKGTVWDRAIESAAAILNGLESGDRVCIFLAADDVKPVVAQLTSDREFAVAQLRALEPGTTGSQLCQATVAAYDSLKEETRRREREIHIITDGQALPWNSFARTEEREHKVEDNGQERGDEEERRSSSIDLWQPQQVDKRTAFFVILAGVPSPENAAPLSVELQPHLIMGGMPSKLKVKLGYSGPLQSGLVTVHIRDEEIARRATSPRVAESDDLTFVLPPLEPGTHSGRVETPADRLGDDNVFHFLIRVREKLPSLCVGSRDDVFYLLKALRARVAGQSPMVVQWIGSEDLPDEELSGYSCVFLCNALPLEGQSILQLEDYVRQGGVLAVFPGHRAALEDYSTWSCLPGYPSSIDDVGLRFRKRALRLDNPHHALLRTLKLGPGGVPVITVERELTWEKLHASAESIISAGAANRFLLDRAFGNGHVLFFSVSADRSWGNFPLSAFFLPLAHQVVHFGAGISGATPYLWTTRSLSLREHLPAANRESVLLDPGNNNVPIRSVKDGNKTVLHAEGLLMPGIYLLSGSDNGEPQPALAINMNRKESNLTPVKKEDIPGIVGTKKVNVAADKEELLRLVEEHRVGRTLGELALWLAFLLAAVEVFYANRKSKSVPSLSETLGIEASGKVSGR